MALKTSSLVALGVDMEFTMPVHCYGEWVELICLSYTFFYSVKYTGHFFPQGKGSK